MATPIINIELVQDKYTNFIIYDGSDRTNVMETWIDISDIYGIQYTFTADSDILTEDVTFTIDSTQKAKCQGNEPFYSYDFSAYDCAETMTFIVNGVENEIEIDSNISSISDLISEINSQLTSTDVTVYANGQYVAIATVGTGSSVYITTVDGDLLTRLGFALHITYRGHDIPFGDPSLTQADIYYYVYVEDLGFTSEIPDARWETIAVTTYIPSMTPLTYTDEYIEYSYKLTEIFRALSFEYIAKNFKEFELVEQRCWTDLERYMYSILQFDAAYKAFLSAVDVGYDTVAIEMLEYLVNYRLANPITT
jgi:hypothetical protein